MEHTLLWQRYRAGKAYQSAMGFTELFPQCVDFREGRQWPAATKATRSLPRPVFNFCDKYVRTKRANILNQPVQLVYAPAAASPDARELAQRGARVYSDFAATLWKELRQDDLNESFLDDAATLGTGILHYYWDPAADGGALLGHGALRGEVLDPLTVLFGDPQEQDVQAQPYILIATRVPVERVRGLARAEGLPSAQVRLIAPDDEEPDTYEASRLEDPREKKCTLLTMYYREAGKVYYDRATKSVTLVCGRSLTPGMPDLAQNGEGAAPDAASVLARGVEHYPLAVMQWQKRKRSIYGIGEVEGMIPAQKAVNWLMGMNVLSVQDTAWPKLLVKPGALRQEVTNTPGEIIEDHSIAGSGIGYLQTPGISVSAMALVDKLGALMQDASGVTEVVSGDPYTSNMAASAIIALQNQAKQPIISMQKRFYRVLEEVGRIWEEFFKFYYTLPRPLTVGTAGENAQVLFVGSDFAAVDYRLEVDAGAGSEYSEALSQATLDRLFERGDIDLDTYVELCPKNVMPFKEQLKRCLARLREQRAIDELIAQNGSEVNEDALSLL